MANVNEYITKVLQLIEKEKFTEEEANWIQKETVDGFREHVNPGFLAYRKTVTKDSNLQQWNGQMKALVSWILTVKSILIV